MQANFNQQLHAVDGTPLTSISEDPQIDPLTGQTAILEKKEPVLLKNIAINALLADTKEGTLKAEEKLHRWRLAQDIAKSFKDETDLEIEAEDLVLIKKLINENYSTMIVGASYDLLPK